MDSRAVSRFEKRNLLKIKNRRRGRHINVTPFGEKLTAEIFLRPLADFLDGKYELQPEPPPGDLALLTQQIPNIELAQLVLSPLLHAIFAEWQGYDKASARTSLCELIGRHLHGVLVYKGLIVTDSVAVPPEPRKRHRRKSGEPVRKRGRGRKRDACRYIGDNWAPPEWIYAGEWLLDCALTLDYFDVDGRGLPIIAAKWMTAVLVVRSALILRDGQQLPRFEPPPPWTGWYKHYPDRPRVSLASSWRHDLRPAVEEALRSTVAVVDEYGNAQTIPGKFEQQHVEGVNRPRLVPFKIDQLICDLAEQFAVDAIGHTGYKRLRDLWRVQEDVSVARAIGDREFYLDSHCDFRGKVYPTTDLSFIRQDHVRALIKFARGHKLGRRNAGAFGGFSDLEFLEIHTANMRGMDKLPFSDRLKWVSENYAEIRAIAAKPFSTFDLWRKAGKKNALSYVAACIELVGAWDNPDFETHLPVLFDGSANGLQHLTLLLRDQEAAAHVNLLPASTPRDIYLEVFEAVAAALERSSNPLAAFWRETFATLSAREKRGFVKEPVLAYPYGVTSTGMIGQVAAAYREIFKKKAMAGAPKYLANQIDKAINRLLPRASEARTYIRSLAEDCTARSKFLRWGVADWLSSCECLPAATPGKPVFPGRKPSSDR